MVYEAKDERSGEHVAVKTLLRLEPLGLYLLKNEFRSLCDLSHPGLVGLRELVSDAGRVYVVMDLVRGQSLLSALRAPAEDSAVRVADAGPDVVTVEDVRALPTPVGHAAHDTWTPTPIEVERLRRWLPPLVDGLEALHAEGKVHGDLKPSNVMVTWDGAPVILDFGMCTDLREGELAGTRPYGGTVGYLAPERRDGRAPQPASDWFALGAIIYEALCGRPPAGAPQAIAPPVAKCAPDLAELAQSLLVSRPETRADGAKIRRTLGAPGPGPRLYRYAKPIGRRDALETLQRLLADHAIVWVSGESGVGKSTLVEQVLRHRLVLRSRCHPRDQVSFNALDSIVDALVSAVAARPRADRGALGVESLRSLARIFPVLRRVPELAPSTGANVHHAPVAVAALGLRSLLELAAQPRPLVCVFDDVQWADDDSALVLERLLSDPPAGVKFVLVSRDQLAGQIATTLETLRETRSLRELRLAPLEEADTRQLARARLASALAADEAVVGAVARECRGVPALLETLARHLNAVLPTPAPEEVTLSGAIDGLRDTMPAICWELLGLVASAGQPLEEQIAREVLGSAAAQAQLALERLRLLRVVGQADPRTLCCYHDTIAESVLEELPDEVARRLHRRLAEALAVSPLAGRAQRAFHHFRLAGEPELAWPHGLVAAREAETQLAYARAADLLSELRGLGLAEPASEAELLQRESDALALCGRASEAASALLQLAQRLGSRQARASELRAAQLLLHSGHIRKGLRILDARLGDMGLTRPRGLAGLVASVALRRAMVGAVDVAGGLTAGPSAWRPARWLARRGAGFDVSNRDLLDGCYAIGTGLALVEPFFAFDFQSRYLLGAFAARDAVHIARALTLEAVQRAVSSPAHWNRVDQLLDAARSVSGREDPWLPPLIEGAVAIIRFTQGRWGASIEAARRCQVAALSARLPSPFVVDTANAYELFSLAYRGELESYLELAQARLEDASARSDRYAQLQLELALPLPLAMLRADPAEARARARRWRNTQRAGGADLAALWALRVEVLCDLYEGRHRDAIRRLDSRSLHEKMNPAGRLVVMRAQDAELECLALAATLASRPGPAVRRRLRRAARRLHGSALPWASALAAYFEAIACLERGSPAQLEAVDSARSRLERVGLGLYACGASWLSARLAGRAEEVLGIEQSLSSAGVGRPDRLLRIFAPGPSGRAEVGYSITS